MYKLLTKKKRGFTLIELIVVIAILAILAAIAIPSFAGITENADKKVELANARNIATAFNAYNSLNPDAQLTALGADDVTALKTAKLWPEGLGDTEATEALKMVNIADGVALADESYAEEEES